MKNKNIPLWGEEVWEEKIKKQDELGVIHGGRFSKTKNITDKTKKEVMSYLEKKVFPLIKKEANLMDAGVGPLARFSIEFAKKGYDVLGVDISQTTLTHAGKHIKEQGLKNIRLIKDDLTKLEKVKTKFDLVFCFGTFGHIPKILAIETLKIFNSKLNKGGYCFLHLWLEEKPTLKNKVRKLSYGLLHKIGRKMYKSFHVNCSFYSKEELVELFERSGFKVADENGKGFFLLKK